MISLAGKKVVVVGGSRGVGRRVVEMAIGNGARVLAVARQEGSAPAIGSRGGGCRSFITGRNG